MDSGRKVGSVMGMDAELLAIGKYTKEIRDNLEYPADFYDDTPEGATIITVVGTCCNTSDSRLLAEVFNISPWQFQEHCDLSGEGVDLDQLTMVFEYGHDVKSFQVLRDHGFKFYYMPRG